MLPQALVAFAAFGALALAQPILALAGAFELALVATLIPAPAVPLHVGSLSESVNVGTVPSWLTIATGGVLVGGSFLGTSLLTDHEGIRAVNAAHALVPTTAALRRVVVAATRALGVLGLVLVLASSALGPTEPTASFAILVVWIGWWAGFAMSTYLVGNAWPLANPWRTLADRLNGVATRDVPDAGATLPDAGATLPDAGATLPDSWGAWPSVVGLLALVAVEVVSPLAADPRLLGVVVAAYTAVTLAGAQRYGTDAWFDRIDPISRVFRVYGALAPVQRDQDGLRLRLPGTELVAGATADREPGSTAFVVALLWATTFDGLVTTPAWNDLAPVIVDAGVPAVLVYLVALAAGFVAFLGCYRFAARLARSQVDSRLAPGAIADWFAPALVPIAAGYHLAHFLGYFLSLSPALATVLANPGASVLASPLGETPAAQVAVIPGWFGTLELAFVVVGHLLAVWVAHALALEVFPGLLRPIRSQYPFVVVMVAYTMTSAWVVGQPFVAPAYL